MIIQVYKYSFGICHIKSDQDKPSDLKKEREIKNLYVIYLYGCFDDEIISKT